MPLKEIIFNKAIGLYPILYSDFKDEHSTKFS